MKIYERALLGRENGKTFLYENVLEIKNNVLKKLLAYFLSFNTAILDD